MRFPGFRAAVNGRQMRYYPAYLDIEDRCCLVVGGGAVGTRKVETLLRCGARVRVVSPEVSPGLERLAEAGEINLERRTVLDSDMDDAFLVFGATDDPELNRRLHRKARERGRLCNIADQPDLCSFVLPSVVSRGDLTIAVSTSGKSPALAKHIRTRLEKMFGPEYGVMLDVLGSVRKRVLARGQASGGNKALFEELIRSDLLELIRQDDREGIHALLLRVVGPDHGCEDLLKRK
jgi:precorrin-2 dehydrogenase/sirohydrochlorin ferrochelatase